MKLNKYSEVKNGSNTVGAFTPPSSSSSSSSNSSTPSGSSYARIDREIWGQPDSGDDVNGSMSVAGNIYLGPVSYDEDENIVVDYIFPTSEGNLYASSSVVSPEVYGSSLFTDYQGKKTNVLDLLQPPVVPAGTIVMYRYGGSIPDGWAECDGQGYRPKLAGFFSSADKDNGILAQEIRYIIKL